MTRKILFVLLITQLGFVVSGYGLTKATPTQVIRGLWEEIQKLDATKDSSRDALMQTAVGSLFDFDAFYQTALQDHWGAWTEIQKKDFASKFKILFLKDLSHKIKRAWLPSQGGQIITGNLFVKGGRAEQSFVGKKGTDEIHFKVFFLSQENTWKIYDVEIEGALLSRNYRGQFNKILRLENFAGLIARFDKKLVSQGGAL
jgi:ABC-type transporter MlaC component